MNSKIASVLLLCLAPLIWGFGFIGTRWVLEDYSATWCNAIRFIFCLPFVLPYLLYKKTFHDYKKYVKNGFAIGVLLSTGLWIQTIGIAQTTVAKAGFFTVFYAFFTPLICIFIWGRKYRPVYWGLVILAIIGIALLCELNISQFNFGDGLIIFSAVIFSLHIVLVEKIMQGEVDPLQLNFMQTFFMAVISLVIALCLEDVPSMKPLLDFKTLAESSSLSGMIIISIFSTLIAFTIQIVAQKNIKSHIASLIFLLESISAAFFGYLLLGEELSVLSLGGAVLVLISVALVPLTMKKS